MGLGAALQKIWRGVCGVGEREWGGGAGAGMFGSVVADKRCQQQPCVASGYK